MMSRPRIQFIYDAKTGEVSVESINASENRELMHKAFRAALKQSKFMPKTVEDVGEHDVRPIRRGKEEVIETDGTLEFE